MQLIGKSGRAQDETGFRRSLVSTQGHSGMTLTCTLTWENTRFSCSDTKKAPPCMRYQDEGLKSPLTWAAFCGPYVRSGISQTPVKYLCLPRWARMV